jgi:hypothetical protein
MYGRLWKDLKKLLYRVEITIMQKKVLEKEIKMLYKGRNKHVEIIKKLKKR